MTSPTESLVNPYHPDKPFFPCRALRAAEFAAAPYCYRTEAVLPCSGDALFDVFEDPVSWTVWALGIARVEWTSPRPYAAGTTRTVTFVDGTEVYERFIAWERGREMAFVLEGHTSEMFACFGEQYQVTPLGPGRCRLVWTVAYEPCGRFARAHPWVRPLMQLTFKLYLFRLRRWCKKHAR